MHRPRSLRSVTGMRAPGPENGARARKGATKFRIGRCVCPTILGMFMLVLTGVWIPKNWDAAPKMWLVVLLPHLNLH